MQKASEVVIHFPHQLKDRELSARLGKYDKEHFMKLQLSLRPKCPECPSTKFQQLTSS